MQQNALNGQVVQQCYSVCMQHLECCQKNCSDNCPACSAAALRQATMNFDKYVYERKVQGKK